MIRATQRLQYRNHGFTLVEIMITLTLLSMILLLLFASLHTANHTWLSGTARIEKNDELRLAGDFIRRQITQTIPLVWVNQDIFQLVFNGKQDELTFTSTLPAHRGGGGLYFMTLKTVTTAGSKHLDLIYRQANPEVSPFALTSPDNQTHVLLVEDIAAIGFAYYGKKYPDDEPKWYDRWQNEDVLPELVRLQVHASDPERNWPVMNIPIPATFIEGQPQYILQD